MNFKKICLSTSISLWCGLGFYRGYDSCENKVNKLKAIGYGFCGMFIYLNPIAVPIMLEFEYKNYKKKSLV